MADTTSWNFSSLSPVVACEMQIEKYLSILLRLSMQIAHHGGDDLSECIKLAVSCSMRQVDELIFSP